MAQIDCTRKVTLASKIYENFSLSLTAVPEGIGNHGSIFCTAFPELQEAGGCSTPKTVQSICRSV